MARPNSAYLGNKPIRTEHLIKEMENEIFVAEEYFARQVAQRKIAGDRAAFRMACKRETLRVLQELLAAEKAASIQEAA